MLEHIHQKDQRDRFSVRLGELAPRYPEMQVRRDRGGRRDRRTQVSTLTIDALVAQIVHDDPRAAPDIERLGRRAEHLAKLAEHDAIARLIPVVRFDPWWIRVCVLLPAE